MWWWRKRGRSIWASRSGSWCWWEVKASKVRFNCWYKRKKM